MSSCSDVIKVLQGSSYELINRNKCIEEALSAVWANETVVAAYAYGYKNTSSSGKWSVALFTDADRMVIGSEVRKQYTGYNIFKTSECSYESRTVELKYVDINKSRVIQRKLSGMFGSKFHVVVLEGLTTEEIVVDSGTLADGLLQLVREHKEKYDNPPTNRVGQASAGQTSAGQTAASEYSAPSASTGSKISEIRKLYEEGIITREEMLDLLKSAL